MDVKHIYKMYRDGTSLKVLMVNGYINTFIFNTKEEVEKYAEYLRQEASTYKMGVKYYNGFNEAKSH